MIQVAIDGPAGAGKSSIAKKAANELQFIYVDTGALYRAIGLYAVNNGIEDTKNTQIIESLLEKINIEIRFINGEQRVFLNEEDVSEDIRRNDISTHASNVSAIPKVREFLFDLQRNLANENNVIMDGRDIGTVVLPNAIVKIFLTATPEERAKRRCKELQEKGTLVDFKTLLEEIKQRDYNDSHREISPLKKADDAVLIDSTELTVEETVETVISLIKSKIAGGDSL